jgi:hypothetical protein
MNAIIHQRFDLDELKKQISHVPSMDGLSFPQVSTTEPYFFGDENAF